MSVVRKSVRSGESSVFGNDRYISSNSVIAMQHNSLALSTSTNFNSIKRLNAIEHKQDAMRAVSEANNEIIATDLAKIQSGTRNNVNMLNKTDEVMHNLASGLAANLKYENDALNKISNAVLDEQDDINKLIIDDRINSDVEKAQLAFDLIKDKVEIAAHTSKIAAAVSEEIPFIGDNIAGGVRVIADGAQLAVDIADAARRNGLIKHVSLAVANIKHKGFDPENLMIHAMASAKSVTDLVANMHSIKHTDATKLDLIFSTVHLPEVDHSSIAYQPIGAREDSVVFSYLINCINSPYKLYVSIQPTKTSYKLVLKGIEGDKVIDERRKFVLPSDYEEHEFGAHGSIEAIYAMVSIFAKYTERQHIQGVMVSVFEDLIYKGDLALDYKKAVYEHIALDTVLKMHEHTEALIADQAVAHLEHDSVGNVLRPTMSPVKFRTHSEQIITHVLKMKGRSGSVNPLPFYETLIGPFIKSGTCRLSIIVDKTVGKESTPWFIQRSGTNGQSLDRLTTDFNDIPKSYDIVVSGGGLFTFNGTDHRYMRIRIYGYFSRVTVFTAWLSSATVFRVPLPGMSQLKSEVSNKSMFDRLIDPDIYAIPASNGYHQWSQYVAPNWTVPV
jgi:VP4 protein